VSNALLLFFAGFDTSSTTMSIALHFLATEPECQERLLAEVQEAIAKSGAETLDYTAVQTLPFLEMFIPECLRLYPLTPIERKCVKDYQISGTDSVIPKGVLVQVKRTC
jgi:cytochrome P450